MPHLAVNLDEGNRLSVPDAGHWVSADVHVHMNYGGTYRNTPAHLVLQAQAENLGHGAIHCIVNKEQRFPDIAYNGMQLDAASAAATPSSFTAKNFIRATGAIWACSTSRAASSCRDTWAIPTPQQRACIR